MLKSKRAKLAAKRIGAILLFVPLLLLGTLGSILFLFLYVPLTVWDFVSGNDSGGSTELAHWVFDKFIAPFERLMELVEDI